jgi:hypothetical protein
MTEQMAQEVRIRQTQAQLPDLRTDFPSEERHDFIEVAFVFGCLVCVGDLVLAYFLSRGGQ